MNLLKNIKSIFSNSKKRNIFITVTLIFIAVIIFFLIIHFLTRLTPEEKIAQKSIQDYKNSINRLQYFNINQIRLYNDGYLLFEVEYSINDEPSIKTIVEYNTDTKYIGTDANSNKTISSSLDPNEQIDIYFARSLQNKWQSDTSYIEINIDKIVKRLK